MWYNNAADHIITFMGRSTSSQELSGSLYGRFGDYSFKVMLPSSDCVARYPALTVLLGTQFGLCC